MVRVLACRMSDAKDSNMVIGRKPITEKHVHRETSGQMPHLEGFAKGRREEPQLGSEIRGGPDVPTILPRVVTQSEILELKQQLRLREMELLKSEEFCRVCDETFEYGSSEVCV